jgi:hypothetical protein
MRSGVKSSTVIRSGEVFSRRGSVGRDGAYMDVSKRIRIRIARTDGRAFDSCESWWFSSYLYASGERRAIGTIYIRTESPKRVRLGQINTKTFLEEACDLPTQGLCISRPPEQGVRVEKNSAIHHSDFPAPVRRQRLKKSVGDLDMSPQSSGVPFELTAR